MRGSTRRRSGLAALAVLGAMMIPGAAHAVPPTDPQVIVFGNVAPDVPFLTPALTGDPGWNDPTFGYSTLFANSMPVGRGERGDAYYYGLAQPNMYVDVEVTDGVNSIFTTVATAPPSTTPAIDGYQPGQFGFGVDCGFGDCDDLNAITVTGLGVHKAQTNAAINPDGSASTNPAHWGPSTLTFKFTVRNPVTNEESNTVSTTLTKYAGTPSDTRAPISLSAVWPPEHWCHFSSRGANEPFGGNTFGGTRNGECSSLAQAPIGAFPDVTWIFCLNAVSNPQHLIDPTLPENPFRDFYCEAGGEGAYIPQGETRVQGVVSDNAYAASGLASEIASIEMRVMHGDEVWMPTKDVTLARFGPNAAWGNTLKINDFQPNYPNGDPYEVQVTVKDAWGRQLNLSSGDIYVYPY